ncbi:MAG: Flp family type IVb pilin [Alphaproteobacteria bacterium]|nr:Flp family type IVb pilin [Alphaproteobacteria bacterium]
MTSTLQRLVRDESAATSIEYALIATLVSTFIIGSLTFFADSLGSTFDYISTKVSTALGS